MASCGWGEGSCISNDTRDFTRLEMGLVVVACGPSSDQNSEASPPAWTAEASSERISKLEFISTACVCQVTVSVNGGRGETSASFIPEEPLCDGRWHSISGEFRPQTRALCTPLSLYRSNAEMSLQWRRRTTSCSCTWTEPASVLSVPKRAAPQGPRRRSTSEACQVSARRSQVTSVMQTGLCEDH